MQESVLHSEFHGKHELYLFVVLNVLYVCCSAYTGTPTNSLQRRTPRSATLPLASTTSCKLTLSCAVRVDATSTTARERRPLKSRGEPLQNSRDDDEMADFGHNSAIISPWTWRSPLIRHFCLTFKLRLPQPEPTPRVRPLGNVFLGKVAENPGKTPEVMMMSSKAPRDGGF